MAEVKTYSTPTAICAYFESISAGSLSYLNGKYTLNKNVTLTVPTAPPAPAPAWTEAKLVLNNEEVFDGKDYTITLDFSTSGLFGFNSSTMKTAVNHLVLAGATDKIILASCGAFTTGESNFTLYKCVNLIPSDTDEKVSGFVGVGSNNFRVIKAVNKGNLSSCGSYSGGIVGAECYNYKAIKCENESDLGTESDGTSTGLGGICGSSNTNAIIIKCKNTGTIQGSGVGGIVGCWFAMSDDLAGDNYSNITQNGHSDIVDCVNTGDILDTGKTSGGIAGEGLGYYRNTKTLKTQHTYVNILGCKNLAKFTGDSHGICGDNVGHSIIAIDYAYTNNNTTGLSLLLDNKVTITIKDCSTITGAICGNHALLSEITSIYYNTEYKMTKLIVKNSTTKERVAVVASFAPNSLSTAEYVKSSGDKVNLIKHFDYISRKH